MKNILLIYTGGTIGMQKEGKDSLVPFNFGEVAEWLKAHAWKACKRETVSGVRIPSSPHNKLKNYCLPMIYKVFIFYVVRFVVVLELKHSLIPLL